MRKTNLEAVTIEECIDMHEKEELSAVINDGKLVGFRKETENRKVLPPTKARQD